MLLASSSSEISRHFSLDDCLIRLLVIGFHVVQNKLPRFTGDQQISIHPNQLFFGVSHHLGQALIALQDAPFVVNRNPPKEALCSALKTLFAFSQSLLGLLAQVCVLNG